MHPIDICLMPLRLAAATLRLAASGAPAHPDAETALDRPGGPQPMKSAAITYFRSAVVDHDRCPTCGTRDTLVAGRRPAA
jgi:hypothetical protein